MREALANRILCLDGAMGTAIQAAAPTALDFGGEEFEGCNEHLNLTRPDLIESIHRANLEAGADIIETNTFGSTALVLREYPPLQDRAHEITLAGARLARRVVDSIAGKEHPRFVAGSMGPTTKAISVTGGVTFGELRETYADQARALVEGGVDYLLIETAQDTRNVKAAVLGCRQAFAQTGREVPIAVSGTIEPMGTMLAGQTAEAFAVSLQHQDLLYIGLNCATGPDFMTDHIRALAGIAQTPVACVPNAGMPDEEGLYLETPQSLASVLERFVEQRWLNLVGGCCGTTPDHIAALARMVAGRPPRAVVRHDRVLFSGLEMVESEPENRPLLVGERTNSLGSRRFKKLIAKQAFESAAEIARRQVRGGAQILDICLQNPDRDETADMRAFLDKVVRMVKAPFMIDSTDAEVIGLALQYCQGRSIINSINLEDGLRRFEAVVPLARDYGAALVVGCIDEDPEQGMAVTRERKLEIAARSYEILTRDFGVAPSSILFDPLVFPCATGDRAYLGSARETVEGIRLIKRSFPGTRTILGISNVSFGLPPAGREVLNSVFLYHCTKAGLDLAIVNSERLERFAGIPEEDRRLAEAVLFETAEETVAAFANRYRAARPRHREPDRALSADERLARCIVEGTKEGLTAALDEELAATPPTPPLEIINGPLMAGMGEVGRLFNDNQLIVAEVLQSAEAMKAAVTYLEPHMDRTQASSRGTVLLATVKGDVHDIGKNLVDIILTNNGYRVVNLGIKVAPHALIEAVAEHDPDLVGLSGLLVKSAHQMVVTAEELAVRGHCPPLLVGGAALTRKFTRIRIAPAYGGICIYAKDAMQGLDLANRLMDPSLRPELEQAAAKEAASFTDLPDRAPRPARTAPAERVTVLDDLPQPPDLERHLLAELPLDEVWAHLNPRMLFGKHLGLKGKFDPGADPRARKLFDLIEALKTESRPGGTHPLRARAVWRFFPARSAGDSILLPGAELRFPRQAGGAGRCLADFVSPREGDHLCLFAVTAGEGVREAASRLRDAGELLKSHALQALAIETAEAAAEWLHRKLRALWGFADPPALTMRDRFAARYRGKRYSFGYPACPDLEMQEVLFELLEPEEIGIQLTDGHMMDPEASVSALVLHHPEARYFSAR